MKRTTRIALALGTVVLAATGIAAAKLGPLDNGKLIFQAGRDLAGHRITARKKPLMASCAACHLPSGAGGVKLPGGAVSADLRHKSLSKGPHPYTLALLERAISTGIDNDGKPLDAVMPRWQLSKQDLHDVALYVQSLK